jgi:hypothetical protein
LLVVTVIDNAMRTKCRLLCCAYTLAAVRSPEQGKPGTQQQQQRALAAAGTALYRIAAEDAALAAEREQGSMTFASQQAMAQQLVAGALAGAEYVPAPLTTLTQLQVVRSATAVADVCTRSNSVASSGVYRVLVCVMTSQFVTVQHIPATENSHKIVQQMHTIARCGDAAAATRQ